MKAKKRKGRNGVARAFPARGLRDASCRVGAGRRLRKNPTLREGNPVGAAGSRMLGLIRTLARKLEISPLSVAAWDGRARPGLQRARTHVARRAPRLCLHSAAAPRCAVVLASHWPSCHPGALLLPEGRALMVSESPGKDLALRRPAATTRAQHRLASSWPFCTHSSHLSLSECRDKTVGCPQDSGVTVGGVRSKLAGDARAERLGANLEEEPLRDSSLLPGRTGR